MIFPHAGNFQVTQRRKLAQKRERVGITYQRLQIQGRQFVPWQIMRVPLII